MLVGRSYESGSRILLPLLKTSTYVHDLLRSAYFVPLLGGFYSEVNRVLLEVFSGLGEPTVM